MERRVAGVLALLALLAVRAAADDPGAAPLQLRAQVLASYPHDPQAFTQGLVLHDGALYESTGLYGRSSVRQVELATGAIVRRVDLPSTLFGEGLALVGDRLFQLTWREGEALTWALPDLAARDHFKYDGEGWGLCFDGAQLVQSDGSQRLVFRDPTTFAITRQLAVTQQGTPVTALNELECVGDRVYANIWLTDRIVEVSALNGHVRAVIEASGLLSAADRATLSPDAILNGIAFDPRDGTFLLTGKLWPRLFRVRFVPR